MLWFFSFVNQFINHVIRHPLESDKVSNHGEHCRFHRVHNVVSILPSPYTLWFLPQVNPQINTESIIFYPALTEFHFFYYLLQIILKPS